MKTRSSRTGKGAIGVLMLAAAYGAGGAPQSHAPAAAKAMPPGGAVCQGCHGPHGEGTAATGAPRLAGQSVSYLDKELRDYASGARDNPVMGPIAKTLSDPDRAGLAAYYASLSAPFIDVAPAPAAAQIVRGHELALQGSEARRVQACNNCHGPEGSGVPLSAPYLAGQSALYMAAQLRSWQQGSRKNDAGKLMASVAAQLDDADIAAVTAYYSNLPTSSLPNSSPPNSSP